MSLNRPSLKVADDDAPHSLLEPPSPAYSNVTVRRAFIVWMYCGQTNKFKDVCNYYHYLEALEEKLPLDQRAASRHHEFNMFCNPPPTSSYLLSHFPKLYSDSPIEPYYIKKLEAIKNEKCIFKLEGFNQIRQKGVTTAEIIETSQIIRKYCQTQMIPLRRFLGEYRAYANICGLPDTVYNVASYIKRKMVQAELETLANFPTTFDFLDSTIDSDEENEEDSIKEEICHEIEVEQPDETNKLKLILGMNNDSNKENMYNDNKENIFNGNKDNICNGNKENEGERRYNSCAEFFQSFNQQPQNARVNSYSPLTPQIEDFVKLFDQNRQKSKSVENLIQGKPNIVNSLSFTSQDCFDSSLVKLSELNRLRKI